MCNGKQDCTSVLAETLVSDTLTFYLYYSHMHSLDDTVASLWVTSLNSHQRIVFICSWMKTSLKDISPELILVSIKF